MRGKNKSLLEDIVILFICGVLVYFTYSYFFPTSEDTIDEEITEVVQQNNPIVAENKAEITSLYQSILGREPEASGLSYWLKAVDTGQMTIQQVKNYIYDSVEYKTKNFNEQAYLKANPDVAQAIANGSYKGTGYDHYIEWGLSEGRKTS